MFQLKYLVDGSKIQYRDQITFIANKSINVISDKTNQSVVSLIEYAQSGKR